MGNDTTYISFYNKIGVIRIFKKTVRSIGSPQFIRFLIHESGRTMVVEPFDRITLTSFRVPKNEDDEREGMQINSKTLTRILAKRMGWDITRSYRIPGKVYESQKVVVFDLTSAIIITKDNLVNSFGHAPAEKPNGENNA